MEGTFLENIDTQRVESIMKSTEDNVAYLDDMSVKTAQKYTKDLDALMQDLYKVITKVEDAETVELERYYLELTSLLYFIGEDVEKLNIYSDMAKSAAREIYNKVYLASQVVDAVDKKKPTVAELTALAESGSQYENVVYSVYNHAYSMAKQKLSAGFEMVNTLRKVLSRRQSEAELSRMMGGAQ